VVAGHQAGVRSGKKTIPAGNSRRPKRPPTWLHSEATACRALAVCRGDCRPRREHPGPCKGEHSSRLAPRSALGRNRLTRHRWPWPREVRASSSALPGGAALARRAIELTFPGVRVGRLVVRMVPRGRGQASSNKVNQAGLYSFRAPSCKSRQETASAQKSSVSKVMMARTARQTLAKGGFRLGEMGWWWEKDLNLRRRKPADLQSALISQLQRKMHY